MVKSNCIMKSKFGFSLMEACVVMLIASIFFVVMANVVPRKVSKKAMSEAHGRFECYYDAAGNLKQEEFSNGASTTGSPVTSTKTGKVAGQAGAVERGYCLFKPNRYAKYYIINVVGAGAKGSEDTGGNAGKFSSIFVPAITQDYWLFPGIDDSSIYDLNLRNQRGATFVAEPGAGVVSGRTIAAVDRGSEYGFLSVDINDINECSFTKTTSVERYDCGRTPTCNISDGKIRVNSCVNQEKYIMVLDLPLYDTTGTALKCHAYSEELAKNVGYKSMNDWADWKRIPKSTATIDLSVCDYTSLMSNPWAYEPAAGSLIYPDVYVPKEIAGMEHPHTYAGGAWYPRFDYNFAPSLYEMVLKVDVEAEGTEGSQSKMATMADVFEYSEPLKSAGNGGAAGDPNGHPGAIVITW